MVQLVGISGSLRQKSFNTSLLHNAQALLPNDTTLEVLSLADVPLYDGDLENSDFPQAVNALQNRIKQANGLILASPEYNHGVPGVLKNAIDWLSRPKPGPVFAGLPVLVIGATPGGMGTLRAQGHWLPVLRSLGCAIYTGPELGVSHAHEKLDDAGRLSDAKTTEALKACLAGFAAFAGRHSR